MASRAHEPLPTASSDTSTDVVVIIGTSRRSRDEDFTAFVTDHPADLLRTAWLLCGDTHRAEDLTQQALVRTYGAWSRAGAGDPLAYARRVLVNLRIDTWRRRRREVLVAPEDLPDDVAHPGTAPHRSTADHQADRDQLVRALATLSPRQRRVVVLRHLVGLPEADVAADLGISVGTVKSTSSRALAQLRATLSDAPDGAAPPSASPSSTPAPRSPR